MRIVVVSGESFVVKGNITFVKARKNGAIEMFLEFRDRQGKHQRVSSEDIIEIVLA